MKPGRKPFTLVIHGGAGGWQSPAEREEKIRQRISDILTQGHALLAEGGTSLDAVQLAVSAMEDSGLLNAGKGAVRNQDNKIETDACIMDGNTLRAGAVGSVQKIKNPVQAARLVMEHSPHVLLVGAGAENFLASHGATLVENSYFLADAEDNLKDHAFGTVGAVALDQAGNLAAATSTGGIKGKLPGRVGDSPIVGAGNYADRFAAVSTTGQGEFFIRYTIARDIAALMEYRGMDLQQASAAAIAKLTQAGGSGGFIALDSKGNVATPYNTAGMLRGVVQGDGNIFIAFRQA